MGWARAQERESEGGGLLWLPLSAPDPLHPGLPDPLHPGPQGRDAASLWQGHHRAPGALKRPGLRDVFGSIFLWKQMLEDGSVPGTP